MKKKIVFINLLILMNFFVIGQNFSIDSSYSFQVDSVLEEMIIRGNVITLDYKDVFSKKENELITFKINYIEGMPFFELSKKMPVEVAEDSIWRNKKTSIRTDNKILFLAFKKKNNVMMFAFTEGYSFKHSPLTATRYDEWGSRYKDCSSCLVEKSNTYSVSNLSKLVVDTPWVEGVKGDGIGEGFTIECNSKNEPLGPYLFIMNGYISYNKPYLYKQNNRVKQLKVTGLKSGKTKVLNILDTPHPQTLDISFITMAEDIRIEIADVYKGTKYDDTCLHYCISFDEEVIPYENSIAE